MIGAGQRNVAEAPDTVGLAHNVVLAAAGSGDFGKHRCGQRCNRCETAEAAQDGHRIQAIACRQYRADCRSDVGKFGHKPRSCPSACPRADGLTKTAGQLEIVCRPGGVVWRARNVVASRVIAKRGKKIETAAPLDRKTDPQQRFFGGEAFVAKQFIPVPSDNAAGKLTEQPKQPVRRLRETGIATPALICDNFIHDCPVFRGKHDPDLASPYGRQSRANHTILPQVENP